MLLLRSVLIHIALIAPTVVVGQQQFPPPITEDCDPCLLVEDGAALSTACQNLNPIVAQIVAKDSACARDWDAFCLLKYNDCYNQACGPSRQGLINNIASDGTFGRAVNRTQILSDCPETEAPSSHPTQSSTASPSGSPSSHPSLRPSDGPSLHPSSSPTISPTPAPSPSPSTPFPTVDPECQGRPWVITFLYNGGDCAQSYNQQARQEFDCTDADGSLGPPTTAGEESYITAVPRGGGGHGGSKSRSGTDKSEKSKSESGTVFFAGTVPVGEKYTLNADRVFDKLAAEMTLTIYDEEGGNLLQVVNVHLSCSQPLILFDKYGASEVTQWVETDGRIVSLRESGVVTGVYEEDLGITDSF